MLTAYSTPRRFTACCVCTVVPTRAAAIFRHIVSSVTVADLPDEKKRYSLHRIRSIRYGWLIRLPRLAGGVAVDGATFNEGILRNFPICRLALRISLHISWMRFAPMEVSEKRASRRGGRPRDYGG